MPKHIEPKPADPGALRFAIVVSQFNEPVTSNLLLGALDTFREQGIPEDNLTVAFVPGAFELPLACQELAKAGNYDAIVALGAVIRGETSHYDHVCNEAASGLMRVGLDQALPVVFGVLTTDDADQALARAGGAKGNKGCEAAATAMQLCGLLSAIRGPEPS